MLPRRLLRFRHDARGAAAVEVALAFPFIVMLASGLFEYGSIFYQYELIQTGLRDAARYLARVENPAASEATARNLAIRGTVDTTGAARVKDWQPADIQIAYETTPNPIIDTATGARLYRGRNPLIVIRLSTSIDHSGLGLLQAVGLGPVVITASHEERYVGE